MNTLINAEIYSDDYNDHMLIIRTDDGKLFFDEAEAERHEQQMITEKAAGMDEHESFAKLEQRQKQLDYLNTILTLAIGGVIIGGMAFVYLIL